MFEGDPLDRLVRLRIDRRDSNHPPPQLLGGLEVGIAFGLQRVELDRAEIRQARKLGQQDQVLLLDRLGVRVRCLARFVIFGAEFRHAKPQMLVEPFDRGAIGFALQPQCLEEGVGEGAVVNLGDLIGAFVGAARGYRDRSRLPFRADPLPVARALVAACVQQQDHVLGPAAPQPLRHITDRDRRLLDIAGVGVDRHEIVAIPVAPAVAGEKEPEIIAWLQEFLLEPDAQKPAQRAAARRRAHRFAEIGRDRRRVFGKEINLVETGLLLEEVTQRLCVVFCILQRLQIVVPVDADADRPVLAHGAVCRLGVESELVNSAGTPRQS